MRSKQFLQQFAQYVSPASGYNFFHIARDICIKSVFLLNLQE